ATDIFSWGVTAWELLSFSRPFAGQHISTVLYQILNEPQPPLRDVAPDVPAEVIAIVDRCLEKKPERRYPSCTELLADLDRALKNRRLAEGAGAADAPPAVQPHAQTRILTGPPRSGPVRTGAVPVRTSSVAVAAA